MNFRFSIIPVSIALALFFTPFFWLPLGFVDMGGDSGRIFFTEPSEVFKYWFGNQTERGALMYAFLPYFVFILLLKTIFVSPTIIMGIERGFQLALSFYFMYLITIECLKYITFNHEKNRIFGIATGIIYLSFITKLGWTRTLDTHNQIFLNPLIFYLLLRLSLTQKRVYGFFVLLITIIFSGNFGFSAMPQILSFYPLVLIFLWLFTIVVSRKEFPYNQFFFVFVLFLGLHAFHIIPTIASIFDRNSTLNSYIFNQDSIHSSGVYYFSETHKILGKISIELFQPANWRKAGFLFLIIPATIVFGLLKKPPKLLLLLSIFFAVTLFLTSANITHAGVKLYKLLFYIPGFLMFRSFQEKWYYVHSFFYALTLGVALYTILKDKTKHIIIILVVFVCFITVYRIHPFLRGDAIREPLFLSDNVLSIFSMDQDHLDTLLFLKSLPEDGKVATLPFTFPYYQIFFGKEGGAYQGVSWIPFMTGRKDFSGFWSFGKQQPILLSALEKKDINALVTLFSHNNIRYIFINDDPRVMNKFPSYPYHTPKESLPLIENPESYKKLLAQLPISERFRKGHYTVYELDPALFLPLLHTEVTPDVLTYTKISSTEYRFAIDVPENLNSLKLNFLDDFSNHWKIKPAEVSDFSVIDHREQYGYANVWTLDFDASETRRNFRGVLYYDFRKYFTVGRIISVTALIYFTYFFISVRKYTQKI